MRGRAGRPLRITFRLNRRAVVRVAVRRAGRSRVLRTRQVNGRAGRNLVLVGGLPRGRWTARLSARAADGRRDGASVAIVVRAAAAPVPRFTG
ncbi:MAG: hypothetical protein ACXWZZ_13460 [Solirubrobacteraceae bacterium]